MGFIAGVVRYEMNEARGKSGLDELPETRRSRNLRECFERNENASRKLGSGRILKKLVGKSGLEPLTLPCQFLNLYFTDGHKMKLRHKPFVGGLQESISLTGFTGGIYRSRMRCRRQRSLLEPYSHSDCIILTGGLGVAVGWNVGLLLALSA
jgi:hypothetical protein